MIEIFPCEIEFSSKTNKIGEKQLKIKILSGFQNCTIMKSALIKTALLGDSLYFIMNVLT